MSLEEVKKQGYGFAIYPYVKMYNYVNKSEKNRWSLVKQLLFGDLINFQLKDGEFERIIVNKKPHIKIKCRGRVGFILENEIQSERILEINFVDVGQGDGCHIVTPNEKHLIVDAGVGDNMFRFLKWRFNLKISETKPPILTAIISHPDQDHYGGFSNLFMTHKGLKQQLSFDKIFHNGIFEINNRKEAEKLGKTTTIDGKKYIEELFETDSEAKEHLKNIKEKKGTDYEKTLKKAIDHQADIEFSALWKENEKKFYKDGNLEIDVLGPIIENIQSKKLLRYFEGTGPTKNGHSIILLLKIGNARILLGGDLNKKAEEYLLERYSGIEVEKISKLLKKEKDNAKINILNKELEDAILKARKYLQCDIAKACHHGSHDFSYEFLKSLNVTATIVSSGDNEPHCHPRPDTLGTIGKFSRGERPLIFSTELARSSREFIDLKNLSKEKKQERTVTVYGMINLRTDGEKMIIAQKLERKAPDRHWDIHKLEWNKAQGVFEYVFNEK